MLGRKFRVSDSKEKTLGKKKQNKRKKASKRKTGINYRKGERETELRDTKKSQAGKRMIILRLFPPTRIVQCWRNSSQLVEQYHTEAKIVII